MSESATGAGGGAERGESVGRVGPPRLRTSRLELTSLGTADLDAFLAVSTDPEARRYLFDDRAISRVEANELLARNEALWREEGLGLFAVREPGRDAFVGYTGLWYFREPPELELLYVVHPTWWGRGYATEAAQAVLRDSIDRLGRSEVVASTDVGNEASVRVMTRLGFTFDRRDVVAGLDTLFYRITAERVAGDRP